MSSDILNSWKEIAAYMGRGVRTVQRWETELGLPVRRPWGKTRSSVIAVTSEVDAWVRTSAMKRSNGANGEDGLDHEALRNKLLALLEEYRCAGLSLTDDLRQVREQRCNAPGGNGKPQYDSHHRDGKHCRKDGEQLRAVS